ncbi:hypothetical protein H6P81_008960 [Aristolochia fimbriata]|uniref:Rad60/SUMO-like domain-containing protein n=1 Tax=Aristolochia fimbriata TaxID=158543 RepID=A0AAV7EJG1_ARIFI|nr:hypothetical protein H6P81_008960 [Aristolochia fimbriata]
MEEPSEELEPLFDYSRIQPIDFVYLDDDCSNSNTLAETKRKRQPDVNPAVEKVKTSSEVVQVPDDDEKEEDWLPPPPKRPANNVELNGDSTLQELRLKKKELASFAQSVEEVLREVEEAARREVISSAKPAPGLKEETESKGKETRQKVVISIQDMDGLKSFRMYMDDKFEKLFKLYSEKVDTTLEKLVFLFDGDKVNPSATPQTLDMENEDIIEVHRKAI